MEWNSSALEEPQPLQSNVDTLEMGSIVLDHLPPILQREYFEPKRRKPHNTTSKPTKKQRPNTKEVLPSSNVDLDDSFLEFDPFKDVEVGQFVTMNSSSEDRESGILFFLERVLRMKNVSLTSESMRIIWY